MHRAVGFTQQERALIHGNLSSMGIAIKFTPYMTKRKNKNISLGKNT
jgi:hypothetical protein